MPNIFSGLKLRVQTFPQGESVKQTKPIIEQTTAKKRILHTTEDLD